jgi:hypothetical protein
LDATTFEDKRFALDALAVKVYADADSFEVKSS